MYKPARIFALMLLTVAASQLSGCSTPGAPPAYHMSDRGDLYWGRYGYRRGGYAGYGGGYIGRPVGYGGGYGYRRW